MATQAPICQGCGEEITDIVLVAFGLTYHNYHLGCKVCGKDFSDGGRVEEGQDGFAYCTPCFVEAWAPRCGTCSKSIIGPMVSALNKNYHKECFVCFKCKKPFPGGTFFPWGQGNNIDAYCEHDFFEVQGLICFECKRPIAGGTAITFEGRRYHPEHFLCNLCKKKLAGKPYKAAKGKSYCHECHLKLYE
eukprot:TRINITY_DN3848_c0_g1_i1.p1 TRINITY_DN3848_c0_g1~~TRINITY_DN3848_c0_g1_i1.p1  ORF type:complete len:190 (+),score=19.22 TRINITY_DN3848_c0_g1_i1:115-684(+)